MDDWLVPRRWLGKDRKRRARFRALFEPPHEVARELPGHQGRNSFIPKPDKLFKAHLC